MIQVCPDFDKRLEVAWNKLQDQMLEENKGISQYNSDEQCVEILEVLIAQYLTMSKRSRPKKENMKAQLQSLWIATPESSNISGFGYNSKTKILIVEFRTGKRYSYSNIRRSLFIDFKAAKSKGSFFNTVIKDMYKGVPLS